MNEQLREMLSLEAYKRCSDIKECEIFVEEVYELGRRHEASLS